MRFLTWFIALLPLMLLQRLCASNELDTNRDGKVKIACFGDSLTRGSGSSTGGYPARLAKLLRARVSNYGISGNKSHQLTPRLKNVRGKKYDKAVIMIGTNDARGRGDPRRFRTFVQKALNTAYFYRTEPILMTAPPTCCGHKAAYSEISKINKVIREIARTNELRLVDNEKVFLSMCRDLERCGLISTDGLHLTDLGYRVIAESVSAVILGLDPSDRNIRDKLARRLGLKPRDLVLGSRI